MKTYWASCFILLQLCFIPSAQAYWKQFTMKTNDGLTELRGQLDIPQHQDGKKSPLVVMMPGTGLFDRDVAFNTPGHDKPALVFKDLSQALNARGIATLRFDYRGVHCSFETMPICELCKTDEEQRQLYFNMCHNNAIRKSVTPLTLRSDFRQVYDWGIQHPNIDPNQVIVFAHSEGSLHTAHLIGEKQIKPKGVVLMGGIFSPIQSIIRWQYVDRTAMIYKSLDANKDNFLSRAEISSGTPNAPLLANSEKEKWTFEEVENELSTAYEEVKQNTLQAEDTAPFPSPHFVQGSMAWWKMFFQESTPPLKLWIQAGIPVVNHLGTSDIQVWLPNEKSRLAANPTSQIRIVEHPNKGHTLGEDAIYGPMSPESKQKVVESIQQLLK